MTTVMVPAQVPIMTITDMRCDDDGDGTSANADDVEDADTTQAACAGPSTRCTCARVRPTGGAV